MLSDNGRQGGLAMGNVWHPVRMIKVSEFGSQTDLTVRLSHSPFSRPNLVSDKNSASLRGHTAKIVQLEWDPGHPERVGP